MALTDQVIMPGSDYQAICDATRSLTGKTGTLKSGDISTELGTVTPQTETWILNPKTLLSSNVGDSFNTTFISKGQTYNQIIITASSDSTMYYLSYGNENNIIYEIKNTEFGYRWQDRNYQKLTFTTPPTGALLTWLQENGVKQAPDTAVQPEKIIDAVAGVNEGTPDEPYDAIARVNINVTSASQATPNITVNSSGLITASATQSAGYVTAGTESATKQLPTVDAAGIVAGTSISLSSMRQEVGTSDVSAGITITSSTNGIANSYIKESPDATAVVYVPIPTETKTVALSMASGNQTVINSTGKKLMTAVTVQKPSTLIPSNIKNGVNIGGVVGAIPEVDTDVLLNEVAIGAGTLTRTDNTATLNIDMDLDPVDTVEGHMISSITGSATKSVTVPTEAANFTPNFTGPYTTVYPSTGKLLSYVNIHKPSTLIPSNIKNGVKISGVTGTYTGDRVDITTVETRQTTTLEGAITFSTDKLARYLSVFGGTRHEASADIRSVSENHTWGSYTLSTTPRSAGGYYYTWKIFDSDSPYYDSATVNVNIVYG